MFIGVLWVSKQWGLTASAATGTQTLPISFSTTNYAIVVSQSDWDSNAEKYCARVKTRNKSSFSWFWGSVFQSGNGRLCFIVAGKQKQWGYVTGGSLGNKTVTLPITAPSQIVNVHNTHATNSAGASAGDNNDSVVVLSKSQISVRTDHSVKNAYWLVLCY